MGDGMIRVVIVDDERLFAELMRVALRGAEGITVEAVVHDLKSAIAALNQHRPDVVLCDYHLPDGTGADLARAVRNSLPDTSVLVLTADPSAATLNDVARSGAVGHMTKERGFAEADPINDVEGFDVAYKITILASLAFGRFVDASLVHRQGITRISDLDIAMADEFGYRIKMIGLARRGNGRRGCDRTPGQ